MNRSTGTKDKELFITVKPEVTTLLFYTYVPSYHELENFPHIVLTYGEVKWDPENIMMDRNMPYGDEACVAEISRKWSNGGSSDIFHERNIILGSMTD